MTPEEFKDKMTDIRTRQGNDKEVAHCEMDDLMGKVLTELGYQDGIKIFDEQDKWYA